MATNDHVNARSVGRNDLVNDITGVGQNDDLVHAGCCQRIHLMLNRVGRIGEDHVFTGARQVVCVVRSQTDQTDQLAVFRDHSGFLQNASQ